ncbi:hypothetical protein [Sphingomonas sp.]|uniref:hypothetical protein n=1 Tax=Sphingomonas sp. TaxID=28214 RepID=UPI003F703A58
MTEILKAQFAAPAAYVRAQLAADATDDVTPTPRPIDPKQRAVLDAIVRAVSEWRKSPEGDAFLASLDRRGADEVRAELDALVRGPRFDAVRKFSLGLGLLPQSVSIGFAGQIELLVGLYGSFGYIADLALSGGDSGLYLLGALAEGVDATADIAIQVGLWMNAVSDVPGSYKGAELEGDEGIGASGFTLSKDDDVKAILVDFDAGVGDGVAGLQFHMWTFAGSPNPVAQKPGTYMVILDQLHCQKASESGHDEVYLTFTVDGDSSTVYRYPTWGYYAMKPGDSDAIWNLGRSVWCDKRVDVTVYDSDYPSDDDVIATFSFEPASFGGFGAAHSKSPSGSGSGGKYSLTAYLMDLAA